MAINGISTLETKELKQIAKLELAAAKRLAQGNDKPYYDITLLPTQYTGNTLVNNVNANGLVAGRPWVAVDPSPLDSTSYAFGIIPSSINEGSVGTFNVNTSGVADSTTLYWTIETNASDFATTSGSFVITSNAGSFTVTPTVDVTTEGEEAFTVAVRTGSTSGTSVANTSSITINDTSIGIVSTGLVLHLDAGNPASYPGTGTTWTDLSPSGKNANIPAGSVFYSSADGGSMSFLGGSLSVATITSAGAITGLTNNMTIEVWYKSNGNVTPRFLSTGVGSDGICFGSWTTSPTKWKVSKYGQVDLFVGSVPQNTNVWRQAVVVYSSTAGTKVYIDGVLSETNADTTSIQASGTPTITIGKVESTYHKGDISIVRWYNTVLSDAEILQNYNANIGRYKNPAAPSNILIYYDPSNPISYLAGSNVLSLGAAAFTSVMTNVTHTSPYFTYNGTNSWLNLADGPGYEPGTSDFSVEIWVYHSVIAGSSRVILGKTDLGGLAANWSYGLRTGADGSTYFEVGNGSTSIQSPAFTLSTGQWYQVVGVWTNVGTKTMELYVNGASKGSITHTFTSVRNSGRGLYIGSYNGNEYAQSLNGRTGVFRQYNKALSSAEVLQNFENDRGIYSI